MSDHAWILENLETYLAGGLEADERLRIDRHVTGCKECAAALADQRALDQTMRSLFADVRPAPGLESRMIQGLRVRSRRVVPSSRFLRFAACAAAVLVLGVIGFTVQALQLEDHLQLPGAPRKQMAHGDMSHFHPSTSTTRKEKQDKARYSGFPDGTSATVLLDDTLSTSKDATDELDRLSKKNKDSRHRDAPSERKPAKEKQEKALDDLPARMKALESFDDDNKDLRKVFDKIEDTVKQMPRPPALAVTPATTDTPASQVPPANPPSTPAVQVPPASLPSPPVPPPVSESGPNKKDPKDGGEYKVKEPLPDSGQGKLGDPKAPGYYEPARNKGGSKDQGKPADNEGEGKSQDGDKQNKGESKEKQPSDEQAGGKKKDDAEGMNKKPDQKVDPAPAPAARKIIRSGDIEFEIDKFDPAIAAVTKLVTAIPGAFVATINSDKLPNGKVRGSMVVRVPPEKLDKFLLDVRQELGKVGELKNQRIGSQDVSKTYYDIESRLRAARITEERLVSIIKSGKGEIKDILAAERQLSEWHTKIEEMEGEIRYYNNQVALSTLNITLYEKEIRVAAAMVTNERVNMRIEAEDVEKARQAVLTAVSQAKGRITRDELKEPSAGQYEAVLHFEAPPAAAEKLRAQLRTLGTVAHQNAERVQRAEGGTMPTGDIKVRQNDVQFEVVLYNVANIQPREAYRLEIATPDVPAEYRKLQEEVAKLKGQVRLGQLNEQDKLNVTAQFDFDVPTPARAAIDKLLATLGEVLGRNTTRAGPGETATDTKVGYRVSLKTYSGIAARDTFVLQIAAQDVPSDYRKLQDAVIAAKGQIRSASLNEQDKLNVTAQLDFDVPVAQRETIDKLLNAMGDVLTRTTSRGAPGDTTTNTKVGYRVTLKTYAGIPARDTFVLQIAAQDVPSDYRKLQDAVIAAKGQIRSGSLNEQDKLNVTAQLDFDVPVAQRETIEKLLDADVLSRTTTRAAPGDTATNTKVGYRVTLKNYASIPPRETYVVHAVSLDVPGTYRKLQDAVAEVSGQIRSGNLNEQDKANVNAQINIDVPASARANIDKLLAEIGEIYSRTTNRVAPGDTATDRKVGYQLVLKSAASMSPRERVKLEIEVKDVEQTSGTLRDMVKAKGGTVTDEQDNQETSGQVSRTMLFVVPLTAKDEVVRKIRAAGAVHFANAKFFPDVPETKFATAQLLVTLKSSTPIVPSDEGLWPQIRTSLFYSFKFLSYSLSLIILGLAVVLPWALVLWVTVKVVRRWRKKPDVAAA